MWMADASVLATGAAQQERERKEGLEKILPLGPRDWVDGGTIH